MYLNLAKKKKDIMNNEALRLPFIYLYPLLLSTLDHLPFVSASVEVEENGDSRE